MGRRGRPRNAEQAVGVADGKKIAWDAGAFAGDPGLVRTARFHAQVGTTGRIHPLDRERQASSSDPLGACVAMALTAPGRLVFVTVPQSIRAELTTAPTVMEE